MQTNTDSPRPLHSGAHEGGNKKRASLSLGRRQSERSDVDKQRASLELDSVVPGPFRARTFIHLFFILLSLGPDS